MPPKKKEATKKEDEVVDESTLPPWTSFLVFLDLHPYLSHLTESFLSSLPSIFKAVSRTELIELAIEKDLVSKEADMTPETYANAFKLKINLSDVSGRIAKRDKQPRDKGKPKDPKAKDVKGKAPVSPRSDAEEADSEIQDIMYVFHDYPKSGEEAQALCHEGKCFNMLLHCKPGEKQVKTIYEKAKSDYERQVEERKELISREEEPGPEPSFPVLPPDHPALFLQLQNMSLAAPAESPAHNAFFHVLDYNLSETEGLDSDEEETRFSRTLLEAMKSPAKSYLKYESWVKTLNIVHLHRTEDRDSVLFQRLLWDMKESQADESYFLLCLLHQVLRSGAYSQEQDGIALEEHFSSLWNEVKETITTQTPKSFLSETEAEQVITHDLDQTARKTGTLPLTKLAVQTLTQEIYDSLHLPGLQRFQMPAVPEKTEAQRGEERTALQSFASIPIHEFRRAMVLTQFEEALRRLQPERHWDIGARVYEESLDFSLSGQVLLDSLLFDPTVVTSYDTLEDTLLVAVLQKTPQGRVLRQRWSYPWRSIPVFPHWQTLLKDEDRTLPYVFDVDSAATGEIREKTKVFYPADDSVIKVSELFVGSRSQDQRWWKETSTSRTRVAILKDDLIFGLRNAQGKPEFWTRFLDNSRVLVEMTVSGAAVSLGSESGLTVKLLPDGSVVQQRVFKMTASPDVPKLTEEVEELNRVVTIKGTVIRFMRNGTKQILFANGNVSTLSTEKIWNSVNNKGRRRAKRQKDGIEYQLDSIKTSTFIDPETSAKVTTREDMTIVVGYADGTQVTIHKDGTKMLISADKTKVVIEHPGYATVHVLQDQAKARQHTIIGARSTDSGLGTGDLMLRSHDGLILEVITDSGVILRSFVQKQEADGYNQFSVNRISLVEHLDGTVIKTQQDGEVAIVSGAARRKLTEKLDGDEFAYFYELFSVPEDRSFGVYTADLQNGVLWTKDVEGNLFTVLANGPAKAKLAVSLNIEDISGQDPPSPEFSEGEYTDPESRFLPPPPSIQTPRLFVVSADNKVQELLKEEQLASYFLLQKSRNGLIKDQPTDTGTAVSIRWRPEALPDPRFENSPLANYGLPSAVSEQNQTEPLPAFPLPEHYRIRTFFKHEVFTPDQRSKFVDDMRRYKDWRAAKELQRKDWILKDPRPESEKREEKMALAKIATLVRGKETEKSEQSEEYRASLAYSKSFSQGSFQENPESGRHETSNQG